MEIPNERWEYSFSDTHTIRGYFRTEGGSLEIIHISTDEDRQPIGPYYQKIIPTDEIITLKGWPDDNAVLVNEYFMLGIKRRK